MAGKIVKLLPPHTVYVEPYCGSAAVLFYKGEPPGNSHYYREVLNDTNGLIINFFRVMQDEDKAKKLIYKLDYTPFSLSEHIIAKEVCKQFYKDPENSKCNDLKLAWAWYVNVQMSFASTPGSGFRRSCTGRNNAHVFRNAVDRLHMYNKRMQKLTLESLSALQCINKWDSPQTVFYVDPPYPETDQQNYKGFTQKDFETLVTCISQSD